MKQKILAAIKSALSEKDGSVSASRCLAGASVSSVLIWVSYVVFKNAALPDLSGASLFLTAGFSGYAVNQFSRINRRDGDDNKGQ
jgi:hypothetical protein